MDDACSTCTCVHLLCVLCHLSLCSPCTLYASISLQSLEASSLAREELNTQLNQVRTELSSEKTAVEQRTTEAARLREQLQQSQAQEQQVRQELQNREQVRSLVLFKFGGNHLDVEYIFTLE